MLNHQWLRTFVSLIDIGHFTLTAKKLNMTQPGVSQHIKKLEEACGHSLIKREKKSFELTDKGKQVYEYALKLFENESSLIKSLAVDGPDKGHCYFSCSGSLALRVYRSLIDLQKKKPDLVIHLEAAPSYKILKDLEEGNVDMGIVTDVLQESNFEYKKIGKEELCLILPVRYKGQRITSDLLLECGLMDHPDAKMYLSLYLKNCRNKGLSSMNVNEIKVVGYVNQLSQIPLPTSRGVGFTIIPYFALDDFGKRSSFYVHEPKRRVYEELYIVTRRGEIFRCVI